MRISHSVGLVAVLTATLVLGQAFGAGPLGATRAQAQCPMGTEMTCNRVGADGKGILAGGILGAEIGFLTAAIIVSSLSFEDRQGIDEWWWYALWAVPLAAGGAVAGYFALEDPTSTDMTTGMVTQGFPEVAVALLAVGIAAIVPTFVGVLALTAYSPGADDDGGSGATGDEDAAEDEGGDDESARQSAVQRMLAGGPGLLRFNRGQLLLGLPMVHSAPTFTPEEQEHMGLAGSQDMRVPLVSGVF